VWADPATERVLNLACQVARADVPVLITGPNGTGKERIAEIIQANSAGGDGPFVVLNCGALPSELIEAELFGADAGAYTGASKAREGKFEAADGGTLFLDEIGNLPLAGQMKLLRVLETGRFERLGSNRERQVKVRVISATNADLAAMIRAGTFREDLFYRLNVIELRCRRWRSAPGDILPLAQQLPRRRQAAAPGAESGAAGARLARQCARTEERDGARQPAGAATSSRRPTWACRPLPATPAQRRRAEPDRDAIAQALARAERRHRAGRGRTRAVAPGAVPAHGAARHRARVSPQALPPVAGHALVGPGRHAAGGRHPDRAGLDHLLPGQPLAGAGDLPAVRGADRDHHHPLADPADPVAVPRPRRHGHQLPRRRFFLQPALAAERRTGRPGRRPTTRLGEVLREQRLDLVQRELLLDTMVQNTPVAMLLVADVAERGRTIVYANLAARQLLFERPQARRPPARRDAGAGLAGPAKRWRAAATACSRPATARTKRSITWRAAISA
jgi:hypothetical protein